MAPSRAAMMACLAVFFATAAIAASQVGASAAAPTVKVSARPPVLCHASAMRLLPPDREIRHVNEVILE